MNFTAIDFETATGRRHSACAVGIVFVEDGRITDRFYSLIQPPGNFYWDLMTRIHRIRPEDTISAPSFPAVYPEIETRLKGRTVVAHNERFDRGVLTDSMACHGLDYKALGLPEPWECTMRIYRQKGFNPYSLDECCGRMGIALNHHNALSDALACAELYLRGKETH
jgi:DNA polymerase-3 subunit epsilon